jgi:hypothetical protein
VPRILSLVIGIQNLSSGDIETGNDFDIGDPETMPMLSDPIIYNNNTKLKAVSADKYEVNYFPAM